jgi:hypothetical protein
MRAERKIEAQVDRQAWGKCWFSQSIVFYSEVVSERQRLTARQNVGVLVECSPTHFYIARRYVINEQRSNAVVTTKEIAVRKLEGMHGLLAYSVYI